MRLGKPVKCQSCGKLVATCAVRGGNWMPFELKTIPADNNAIDAYLPIRHGSTVTFVPVDECAPRHLIGLRWYAQRHRCAEYLRTMSERYRQWLAGRERVDGLGDVIAERFGGAR